MSDTNAAQAPCSLLKALSATGESIRLRKSYTQTPVCTHAHTHTLSHACTHSITFTLTNSPPLCTLTLSLSLFDSIRQVYPALHAHNNVPVVGFISFTLGVLGMCVCVRVCECAGGERENVMAVFLVSQS